MENIGVKPTKQEKIDALIHAYNHMDFNTPRTLPYRRHVKVMRYILAELGEEVDN